MKKSKNVVITGVSSGIGFATTTALIARGYRVFGSVRKQEDADRLKQIHGGLFEPLMFDVTDSDGIIKEAARFDKMIGSEGIHTLINNAGIAVGGPMMHLPVEDLHKQMDVNLYGVLRTTQAFLPFLGAKKNCQHAPGRIINISSVAGQVASPFLGAYSASKHAIEAISKSMQIELMLYGIDVIIVGPGVVKTPIWDKTETINLKPYSQTDYQKPIVKYEELISEVTQNGHSQEEFGELMVKVVEAKKPKAHYPLVYKKFINLTLPKWLPAKTFAAALGKRLGLLK